MSNEKCEACASQPVRGVLSHAGGDGEPYVNIERCDVCERFESDADAYAAYLAWADGDDERGEA